MEEMNVIIEILSIIDNNKKKMSSYMYVEIHNMLTMWYNIQKNKVESYISLRSKFISKLDYENMKNKYIY
jgi:hypothetical protein